MKGFIGLPFLLIVIILSIIVILIGGWLMANAVIVAKTTFHISAESQDKGSLGLAILKSAINTTTYTEIFAGSLADNFNQEIYEPIKKQAAASDRKISSGAEALISGGQSFSTVRCEANWLRK